MTKDFFKLSKSKKTILIDENNKKISEINLLKKVQELSKQFESYSVIMIISDNCYDFIAGYVALMNKPNTIKILLDRSFSKNYIEELIFRYKPNYIYLPNNIEVSNINILKKTKLKTYNILQTEFKKESNLDYLNYLLLSTSGTTQSAKFVRLSRNNVFDNTKKIIKSLDIHKNHCAITTMPAGYSYGLSIINTHLMSKAKIVLNSNTIFEKDFWKKLKRFKVNSFGGVPEFYEILKRIDFNKYLIKVWKSTYEITCLDSFMEKNNKTLF